jgi:hypothetical protein
LAISPSDLVLEKDKFRQKIFEYIKNGNKYAPLLKALESIGQQAHDRLPSTHGKKTFSAKEWQDRIRSRSRSIEETLVPDLFDVLRDIFLKRVKRTNVEQRLIEFKVPKRSYIPALEGGKLQDDVKLIADGDAYAIFKQGKPDGEMNWGDVKALISNDDNSVLVTSAIERTLISAISPDIDRDDEQIIRAPSSNEIFRIGFPGALNYMTERVRLIC